MATPRQAERWLALEFVAVVVVRTLHGFREQKNMLGPQQFAAMLVAFGMLSVLVMYEPTAELAAILGLLLLLLVALRPTVDGVLGGDVANSVGAFVSNVGASPPSVAQGFTK